MLDCYDLPKNVIILRTFSKAFAAPNLRIGFMICSEEIYKLYNDNVTINEVSGISCKIAKLLLSDDKYMIKNIEKTNYEKDRLISILYKKGISFYKSDSNVIFSKTVFNEQYFEELLEKNISVVKVCDINNNFHIRIAVQDEQTNNKFIENI